MPTKTVNISFPKKTLKEIDSFARKEELSRSDVLRIGTKKYISGFQKWQELQKDGEKKARSLGLKSEQDIVEAIV